MVSPGGALLAQHGKRVALRHEAAVQPERLEVGADRPARRPVRLDEDAPPGAARERLEPESPEPASRSSTEAPSTGPTRLKSASRTRSPVGRVCPPFGAAMATPPVGARDDPQGQATPGDSAESPALRAARASCRSYTTIARAPTWSALARCTASRARRLGPARALAESDDVLLDADDGAVPAENVVQVPLDVVRCARDADRADDLDRRDRARRHDAIADGPNERRALGLPQEELHERRRVRVEDAVSRSDPLGPPR